MMFKTARRKVLPALALLVCWSLLAGGCRGTKADEPVDKQAEAKKRVEQSKDKAEAEADKAGKAAADEQKQRRYESPDGAYSAPIPPEWKVKQHENWATFNAPEGDLQVHLTAVESEDIKSALKTGWKRVGMERDLSVQQDAEPPTPEGLDGLRVLTYEVTDDQRFYQAVGQLLDGTTYVLLVDGSLTTVQKRSSQVQIISSGLDIAARKETDLKGVADAALNAEKQKKLAEHIKMAMKDFDVPGVSVGVVQDGDVVFKQAFGVRKQGGEAPLKTDTRMMVGSTTKTMTTMLMATAVDAGKMDWETAAREVLPKFKLKKPELTDKVTMRHLVCACTGVPRRDFEILMNFEDMDAHSIFDQLSGFETFTDFGEAFQYSNQMVAAGGYITAAAYGAEWENLQQGYRQAMQTHVFGPIGMEATTTDFEEVTGTDNYATPHGLTIDGSYVPIDMNLERFVLPLAPAGAAWSTTEDMLRYLQTELAFGKAPDGSRVVSEANLKKTWEPQIKISDTASYGLGWIVSETKGKKTISHGGNTMGFTSELVFVPADGLGITILANAQAANAFADSIEGRLMELVYDVDLKATESVGFAREQTVKQFEKMKKELADSVDEAAVEPYLGTWTNAALGEVELKMRDGKLVADAGEFAAEMLPKKAEDEKQKTDEETTYLLVEPPLVGAELVAKETDEGRRIVLGKGAQEYTFEPASEE